MRKQNEGDAVSCLVSKYIGSDFDHVLNVSENISDVHAVSEMNTNINTLASKVHEISRIDDSINYLDRVYESIGNIDHIGIKIDDVLKVSDSIPKILRVAEDITKLDYRGGTWLERLDDEGTNQVKQLNASGVVNLREIVDQKNLATQQATVAVRSKQAAKQSELNAQKSAEVAVASTNIYPTVAEGIAATTDKQLFLVVSSRADGFSDLYMNRRGTGAYQHKTTVGYGITERLVPVENHATIALDAATGGTTLFRGIDTFDGTATLGLSGGYGLFATPADREVYVSQIKVHMVEARKLNITVYSVESDGIARPYKDSTYTLKRGINTIDCGIKISKGDFIGFSGGVAYVNTTNDNDPLKVTYTSDSGDFNPADTRSSVQRFNLEFRCVESLAKANTEVIDKLGERLAKVEALLQRLIHA